MEEKKKNPYHKEYGAWSNTKFILKSMFRSQKEFYYLVPLAVLCAPVMQYLWTFLAKFIIDMITGQQDVKPLMYLMLGFAGVQIVVTMLNTYQSSEMWYRLIDVRMGMITKANRKVMSVDFQCLEDPDVLDCYEKASQAYGGNNEGVEGMMHQLLDLLVSFVVVVIGICILGTLSLWIVLLMLALAVVNFYFSNQANKRAKKDVWDPLATWWRKQYYMLMTTTNFKEAKDIRMYGLKDWLLDKFRGLLKTRYEAQKDNARIWLKSSLISNFLWFLAQIGIYAWLIYSVANQSLTVGNFSLYLASAGSLFNYLSQVLNQFSGLLARSREVDDYRSFLDFDGGDLKKDGKKLPKQDIYEFTFENVSFRYPKAEKYALKDLNLTLKAGERLAVVGTNGAGKSTFIKLLLRLYEPTEGRILLNGVDVREYDKESYYDAFAPVFQQVELFAFPMAENVSMKAPLDTDKGLAQECLERAGLEKKLKSLPKGVDTELLKVLYDDGIDLSGGEKQKLALARALYKEAPVVVLDEPTAALDAHAEAKLYEDFDSLIGGKTAVYISHRLSSTQFCNHVAMFVDGKMSEYGTHQELLAQNGAYAEMFRIQAQYYVEEEVVIDAEE